MVTFTTQSVSSTTDQTAGKFKLIKYYILSFKVQLNSFRLYFRRYSGRDICFGYNEDSLTVYDADLTQVLSREEYDGSRYTHQVGEDVTSRK